MKCFESAATAASASRLSVACTIAACSASTLRVFSVLRRIASLSIALALLVQHVAKPEQPWRAAGVHQRAVEDAVPHHPFLIMVRRIVGIGVGNGTERGERLLHRGKPCRVAALDRAAQRQSFDIDTGLRHVPEVGGRYRADAKAALVGRLHEPVRDQARQRLAHRGEADRELLGEAGDMQLLAGQQPGRENVGAQPPVNGGRQASRPFVGKVLTKTQSDTAHCAGRLAREGDVVNRKSIFSLTDLLVLRFIPISSLVVTARCCLAAHATENRRDNLPRLT